MTNNFLVGTVLPAEHIIGYKRMRKDLRDWAYGTNCGIALIGMHSMGKTSLALELYQKLRAETEVKMLPLFLDLNKLKKNNKLDWYSTLLYWIVDELEEELEMKLQQLSPGTPLQHLLEAIPYLDVMLARFRKADPTMMSFRNSFQRIFSTLKDAGWKIRIILDEFDCAANEDTFQDTADFELFRELTEPEFGVGLLLLSRRQLHTIEKTTRQNSVFSGAFHEYRLVGFQESDGRDGSEIHCDMSDYYAVLRDQYEIELDAEERQELEFYTGGNPYLLSIFGSEMAKDKIENHPPRSFQSIYKKNLPTIHPYLEKVFLRLEADASVDGVSYIQKLAGIVLGPSIDVHPSDIELLQSLGYLQAYDDNEQAYISISKAFTQFLSHKDIKADTWDLILETERLARRLVEREFQGTAAPLDDEQWFTIMAEAFRRVDHQPNLNRSNYLRDISVNRDSFGVELSVLNVMSLKDCFRVIRGFWDTNFSPYFINGQKKGSLEQWKVKFTECGKARNPLAHGNAEFLTAVARDQVDAYCKEFIQTVQMNMDDVEPSGIPANLRLPKS